MGNKMEKINIISHFSKKEMKHPIKNRIVYQEKKLKMMLKNFLYRHNRKNYLRLADLNLDIVSLIPVWTMIIIIKTKTKSQLLFKEIELLNKYLHC